MRHYDQVNLLHVIPKCVQTQLRESLGLDK
jgi:hypothetical protein